MKVLVQLAGGDVIDFDLEAAEPLTTLKCLIESVNPDLGPADALHFTLNGKALPNDDSSLGDIQYSEGDVLLLGGANVPPVALEATEDIPHTERDGAASGRDQQPAVAPATGFQAVQIVVSKCTNEKTNGIYSPAAPFAGKPVWRKPPSTENMAAEETAKDKGERFIYFSAKAEKWYASDALDEGGFSFVSSPGKCDVPPSGGWHNGTVIEFQSLTSSEGMDMPAALRELAKLVQIEPWADQELCFKTMLKVLSNIVEHPEEAKYFSLKIDNPAIQNKMLRFSGAREFLEAVGFIENSGVLALSMDRSAQAKAAYDLLQGFASDAQYQQIRRERHAKAAEETKKDAERQKYARKAPESEGRSGPRFGRGPQRGGG